MGKAYPKAIIEGEVASKIYKAWMNAKRTGMIGWDNYEDFFSWSLDHGGATMPYFIHKDLSRLHSIDNSIWYPKMRYVDWEGMEKDEDGYYKFHPDMWDRICANLRKELRYEQG